MARRSTVTWLVSIVGFLVLVAGCRGQNIEKQGQNNGLSDENGRFQGSWSGTGDAMFFDLDLVQDGSELRGRHCGTTRDATRTDCAMDVEDESSIAGTIVGDVAKVRFVSAYSGASGTAVITLRGDSLTWETTEFPDDEFYVPSQATLHRVVEGQGAGPS